MNTKQFKREAKHLFSNENLNTYCCDYPLEQATKAVNRKFNTLLKNLFPDCIIHKSKGSYCYSSAFVEKDNHFVYVNCEDYRDSNWEQRVLTRTASNEKDYRGGSNNFCDIEDLQTKVYQLLKQEHHSMF